MMNERILQLAASHFPRDTDGNILATPETIVEFAKVIVVECAKVLYDNELGGYQTNYVLKEHFGVE